MSAEIVHWNGVTRLDRAPERVIAGAAEDDLEQVIIVGFKRDGDFYFASSQADGGDTLWLLALAQKRLLEAGCPE